MSRRTRTNLPLPVIGSTGWGGTLNNYLTNQTYAQAELETEIQKIYDNRMNVAQTVLSSGIMDATVDDYKVGLYEGENYITEGTELDLTKTYCFRGWAAIVGNQNITKSFGAEGDPLVVPFNNLGFGTSSTYDARCVYLHYDKTRSVWEYKFGDTNNPAEETKISVHPYYICLGVVIRINSKNYWHYKTMKSNLSISSKKWMLDEPHANLNTYMNWISTSSSLSIFTDNSYFKNAVLTIQALGINPFTETESITNEYNSDIATYNLGTHSTAEGTEGSIWNCIMLCSKRTTAEGESEATLTTGHITSESNTTSLSLGSWVNSTSIYRICASSLIAGGKPVLFLQQAIVGEKIDEALFDESEFGRLMYYADPVELYRIQGNVMTAAVGDGVSTINANGINPHITTVIKNSDDVRFGEDADKSFHFKTDTEKPSNKLELVVPNPISGSTSYILTHNMRAIAHPIDILSRSIVTIKGDQKFSAGYSKAGSDYGEILAEPDNDRGGRIVSFIKDGDKQTKWEQDGAGQILLHTKKIKAGTASETESESKIILTPTNIHLHGNSVVPVTKDFQINNGSNAYIAVQYSNDDNCSTISLGAGTRTDNKIRVTASDSKQTIELGTVGGDCCKLSSDGLYLPSGSDGVVIGDLQGAKVHINDLVLTRDSSYKKWDFNFSDCTEKKYKITLPEITNTFDVYGDSKTTIYLYPAVTSKETEEVLGGYLTPYLSKDLDIGDSLSGESLIMPAQSVDVCSGTEDGGNLLTESFIVGDNDRYNEDIRFLVNFYGDKPIIVDINSNGLFDIIKESVPHLATQEEIDYYDEESYMGEWCEFTLRDDKAKDYIIYSASFKRGYETAWAVTGNTIFKFYLNLTVELILHKDRDDIFWLYPRMNAIYSMNKAKDVPVTWTGKQIGISLSGRYAGEVTYSEPTKSYPKIEKK